MNKNNKTYNIIAIIVMVLMIIYTYFSVLSLGFEDVQSFSYTSLIKLIVIGLSVMVIALGGNKRQTSFSMLWIIWCIWLIIDFFVLLQRGEGISNILHVLFCPLTFVLFYSLSLKNDRVISTTLKGFLILDIVAIIMIIINLNTIFGIQIGEETAITNLIYWCLCPLPILLIMREKWEQIFVIVVTAIMILLTGKRSASIAIALIILIFSVYSVSSEKNKLRNALGIFVIGAIVYYAVSTYLEPAYMGVFERFNRISEDEGSGRMPLYRDVFNVLSQNTIVDWFVGRGYGSIMITRHTNAHNDALQMLFEYGVIGLIVYIRMLVIIFKRMIILRKEKSNYYIAYAASVVITLVLGMVSDLVVFYSYFAFLCAFWGVVEAKMVQSGLIKQIIVKWQ